MHQLPPNKTLALLIHDVGRLLRKEIDQRAEDAGLTSAQWRVLSSVARCETLNQDPPNQASLAAVLDLEPITLSRQIDRLATAGLIERHPDPLDRRAHRLHLTELAWPLVKAFRDQAGEVLNHALAGVDDGEVQAMIGALERIRNNLTGKAGVPNATSPPIPKSSFKQKSFKQGVPS